MGVHDPSGWAYSEDARSMLHCGASQEESTPEWHSRNPNPPPSHWNSPGNTRRDKRSSGTPNVPSENWSETPDNPRGKETRNNQYLTGLGGQHQHVDGEQSQHWTSQSKSRSGGGGSDRVGKGRGHGAGWLGSPRRFPRRDTSGQHTPILGKGAGP